MDGGDKAGRHGSIPAWAGKPEVPRPIRVQVKVHPRVGGETW